MSYTIDQRPLTYLATRDERGKCELNIISLNEEGLRSCLNDQDFVNFVQSLVILFFSETWQREVDNFLIQGYESICIPRKYYANSKARRGGGIS